MLWFGITLFVFGSVYFIIMGVLWYLRVKQEYEQDFHALCPETLQPVDIRIDAALAAKTQFAGKEQLKVTSCSRWPERHGCDQGCTPQVAFLGDSRADQKWIAFGLQPHHLKRYNPVQMTRELYDKMTAQLERQKRSGGVAQR